MRKTTLDHLAECRENLKERKEEIKRLQKVQQEYVWYSHFIKTEFERKHLGALYYVKVMSKKTKKD
tara:strand:+ start:163 stop:360 length:198 start_codon:yes stop_codon:yes gene_type:complete